MRRFIYNGQLVMEDRLWSFVPTTGTVVWLRDQTDWEVVGITNTPDGVDIEVKPAAVPEPQGTNRQGAA